MFEENKKSEEIDEEIIEKFDEWIDKIVFEELKEQLEKRDAWLGTNKKMGFGMKLKGNLNVIKERFTKKTKIIEIGLCAKRAVNTVCESNMYKEQHYYYFD
uniref:Uncharacterized protein n=1 Tax=Meloidogyne enterolobii TaxID=390850 RepID=A0A6V7UR95_MELEN|nr:unnamed protein product [Meloidogyne enterolobii]